MVTIRTGTRADLSAVLPLWREAATEPSATDDAAGLEALLRRDPDALLLAVDRDMIIGTVIVAWDGWRGAMYRLAVAPSQRRNGIATALVAEGERRLRVEGARRLQMIVAADQAVARTFWDAAGYRASDQLRFVKNLV